MKDNIIILKDKDGKSKKYKVLLAVEGESVMENLILYTSMNTPKTDKKNVYAVKININGEIKKESKKEYEFLIDLLNNLQRDVK